MKKLVITILLFAGVWFVFAPGAGAQAYIVEVQGKVELKAKDAAVWKAAAAGDRIENETLISTSFKSTALVSLGASRLTVHPLTTLTLEALLRRGDGEEARLYLRSGRVQAEVSRPAGMTSDFTVRSPAVTASVRGTSFEFDGKHLRVTDGTVLLANNFGQKVYIVRGQRTYVDENSQNRVVPPFEAAAALLEPRLAELDRTARQEPEVRLGSRQGGILLRPTW